MKQRFLYRAERSSEWREVGRHYIKKHLRLYNSAPEAEYSWNKLLRGDTVKMKFGVVRLEER
jgi:hypothetical protein